MWENFYMNIYLIFILIIWLLFNIHENNRILTRTIDNWLTYVYYVSMLYAWTVFCILPRWINIVFYFMLEWRISDTKTWFLVSYWCHKHYKNFKIWNPTWLFLKNCVDKIFWVRLYNSQWRVILGTKNKIFIHNGYLKMVK